MPHVVKIFSKQAEFPEICPFCNNRKADRHIQFTHMQSPYRGLVILPLWLAYRFYKFGIPACEKCKKFYSHSKLYCWLLMIIPWTFYLLQMTHTLNISLKIEETSLLIAIFCSLSALLIYIYRIMFFRKFRIGYFDDNSTYYLSRSKEYSEKFAELNKTASKHKLLFFRLK